MKIIGVTGGIGSGKSAAAKVLADLGAVVIDADRVGHDVYRPGTVGWDRVVAQFGSEVVAADGRIDRQRLGAIVFSDPAQLARLNAIVHPLIRDVVAARIRAEQAAAPVPAIVVEAALLVEAGWNTLVDEVWVITAAPAVVEQRLTTQRRLAPEAVAARIRAQLGDADRAAHAHVVIENSGSMDQLRERLTDTWRARVIAA